jgi:hypothetical protein
MTFTAKTGVDGLNMVAEIFTAQFFQIEIFLHLFSLLDMRNCAYFPDTYDFVYTRIRNYI